MDLATDVQWQPAKATPEESTRDHEAGRDLYPGQPESQAPRTYPRAQALLDKLTDFKDLLGALDRGVAKAYKSSSESGWSLESRQGCLAVALMALDCYCTAGQVATYYNRVLVDLATDVHWPPAEKTVEEIELLHRLHPGEPHAGSPQSS